MKQLLLITYLSLLVGCHEPMEKPKIRPVRVMQVDEKAAFASRFFPGSTRAVDRVNLSFRVSGPLVKRPINVGDVIQKGGLLAEIDPTDFAINLENAEGGLERAKAELRFAESDYERVSNLQKKDSGAISQSAVERSLETVSRLKGEIRSINSQVDQANKNLSYTKLLAPFDGTITAIYVENYEFVQAQESITRMLNTTQVEMVIDIPESMISYLSKVDEIFVKFDAISDQEVSAEIKEIGTEASATTRTYPVTLLINQPEEFEVYAGMSGWAELKVNNVANFGIDGFFLPASALYSDTNLKRSYVWVVNPHTNAVSRRKVVINSLTTNGVLVTSGLKTGEWVVTAGTNRLEEGQKVLMQPVKLNAQGEQIPQKTSSWKKEK